MLAGVGRGVKAVAGRHPASTTVWRRVCRSATTAERGGEETRAERVQRLLASQEHSPVFRVDPERKNMIDTIVRVDHAGEAGAIRIYDGQVRDPRPSTATRSRPTQPARLGSRPRDHAIPWLQLAVLRGTDVEETIQDMREGETTHLDNMNYLLRERRTRPTVLLPLWDVAGFALGETATPLPSVLPGRSRSGQAPGLRCWARRQPWRAPSP